MRYRGLLHLVSRGQRSENAQGGRAPAADVGPAFHLGADAKLPVVGRKRVRHFRQGQHVDHGQFGGYGVHVADGVAAERAGEELQQAVGPGGHVRRFVARPERARQSQGPDVRQVENGTVPVDQGERDPVQAGGPDDRRQAPAVAGTMRRLAGQRAQHVQLAGGLGDEPVGGPGDVRVFRPGGHRPGGKAQGEDDHQHQPHTVHVRHHATDQRRRGQPESVAQGRRTGRRGGRRLRRVRDAGGRDGRTVGQTDGNDGGGGCDRTPGTLSGVRAPERAAGRIAGEEEGRDDRGPGDVERRRQGDIHVGQPEAEEEDTHYQHVRTGPVRERGRSPIAGGGSQQQVQRQRRISSKKNFKNHRTTLVDGFVRAYFHERFFFLHLNSRKFQDKNIENSFVNIC